MMALLGGSELVMLDHSAGKQRTLVYTSPFLIQNSPKCALRSKEPDAAFKLENGQVSVRPQTEAANDPRLS